MPVFRSRHALRATHDFSPLMNKTSNEDTSLFREVEHTGDLGIEVTAPTRSELFRRAALALAALLVEQSKVESSEPRTVEITAGDDIDMMHDC
jgi:hypothetical protein